MATLNCWPGCRAEIISGPNKGGLVLVTHSVTAPGYDPTWAVRLLSRMVARRGGEMRELHIFTVASIKDCLLQPLPELDDEAINGEQFIISELAKKGNRNDYF